MNADKAETGMGRGESASVRAEPTRPFNREPKHSLLPYPRSSA
jgi:hypothetical protein